MTERILDSEMNRGFDSPDECYMKNKNLEEFYGVLAAALAIIGTIGIFALLTDLLVTMGVAIFIWFLVAIFNTSDKMFSVAVIVAVIYGLVGSIVLTPIFIFPVFLVIALMLFFRIVPGESFDWK